LIAAFGIRRIHLKPREMLPPGGEGESSRLSALR
jgi:hypothetical protein